MNWVIGLVLLGLLIGQIGLIVRNLSLSRERKWIRAGLNLLLWLVLVGYFLQIRWPKSHPTTHALLVGNEVPGEFVRYVKDSLRIRDSFSARNLKASYDSVTLVGQDLPATTLAQLSQTALQWVPYNQPDRVNDLQWKGFLQQGELQHVTGRIWSSENQWLALRYGNRTLDSVRLNKGDNTFALQFPAFTRGRTQAELTLGGSPIDTLRFFSRPTQPLTVQFIVSGPDFESKTLANWLGKQGHTVQLTTSLSKNITSDVRINKSGTATSKAPDLIVTEPNEAGNPAIRKAIAEGKSVLFISLTNPEADCRVINQAVGSRWQVRKTSNEPVVPISEGLTALPYRFADAVNQFAVAGYPIAIQQTAGRVGVSLLSETFPLSLSGDTVTYHRIWTAALARLTGSNRNTVQIDAPVYKGMPSLVSVNNPSRKPSMLVAGHDTVQLTTVPVNEQSTQGLLFPSQTGWQTVADTLAIYVNGLNSADQLAQRKVVSQFVRAHARYQTASPTNEATTAYAELPEWAWLVLFLVCLTALWVEPKLS
ncbi:hypothetical protein GCM10027341_12610 [Spirosoma knui]